MKISEKWLRSLVKINKPIQEVAEILTLRGLEVESITPLSDALDAKNIVVAEVISAEKHPDADRLRICQVSDGIDLFPIVCGAANARAGIKVALAKIGATLPQFTIKKSKIRGLESHGMLCSLSELGLADQSEGIMELPEDAPLGQTLVQYLDLDDTILDISITPNRGDCASVLGMAREVAAIEGAEFDFNLNQPLSSSLAACMDKINDLSTIVDADIISACPVYFLSKIINIDPSIETPIGIKERLRRSGLRSVNLLVDITNYIMMELGQPLHAFDAQKIQGNISLRFAKPEESIELLNDTVLVLDEKTLVIADSLGPIALAGIMGAKRAAVSNETSQVFLESAYFSAEVISRSCRKFKLNTDAAYRFERGVDAQLAKNGLLRALSMILNLTKAHCEEIFSFMPTYSVPPKKIAMRYKKLHQILGSQLDHQKIKDYFSLLNIGFEEGEEALLLTVPSYRFDLNIEEDLIEEVLRMHGFDRISEIEPQPKLSLQSHLISQSLDLERLILKSRGYSEIISYSFVDEKLQKQLFPTKEGLSLINPISQDLNVMRISLWTSLIGTLIYNLNRQQIRARLFEVGLCFPNADQQLKKIAGLSYGAVYPKSWNNESDLSHFFHVKNDVEAILAENGVSYKEYMWVSINEDEVHPLHPKQSALCLHRDKKIELAKIGVLHPQQVQALDLPMAPVLFEIQVQMLHDSKKKPQYFPLSKFPEVQRDLSFLLPLEVAYYDISTSLMDFDKHNRIRRVSIFDLYQGKGVAENQKSIAISVILQDFHKTLEEEEIERIMKDLINLVETKFQAKLRG